LNRFQNEGISPFIDNVEKCRANLLKAEADLRAICALVGIPTEDGASSSLDEKPESEGADKRTNVRSEDVLHAVAEILAAEVRNSFTLGQLMDKTTYSRAQVRKATKELVGQGKVSETEDTAAKSPGLKPKLYTWKS
jgi:hypothetical protein